MDNWSQVVVVGLMFASGYCFGRGSSPSPTEVQTEFIKLEGDSPKLMVYDHVYVVEGDKYGYDLSDGYVCSSTEDGELIKVRSLKYVLIGEEKDVRRAWVPRANLRRCTP